MPTQSVFVKWEPASTSSPPNQTQADQNVSTENPANPAELRQPNAHAQGAGVATQVTPRFDLLLPGEPVSFDLELQEYSKDGGRSWQHRMGWIGVVNTRNEVILDCHIKYRYEEGLLIKFPPKRLGFGVDWKSIKLENGAVHGNIVEDWCMGLFKDRKVIVHSGYHDQIAFYLRKPFQNNGNEVIDTQVLYSGHGGYTNPGLAFLTADVLERVIQAEKHTPVEDATATMELYLAKHSYDRGAEAAKWVPVYEQRTVPTPQIGGYRGRGGHGRGTSLL